MDLLDMGRRAEKYNACCAAISRCHSGAPQRRARNPYAVTVLLGTSDGLPSNDDRLGYGSGLAPSGAPRNDGLSRQQRARRLRLRARAAHPRQQFGRRPGIRRQAVFHLHRLDRDAALLAEHAVDLADIEAGAHQQLLQFLDLVELQLRHRRAGWRIGAAPAMRVAR